jgi:hypothetical protein
LRSSFISFWKLLVLDFGADVLLGLGSTVEAVGLEKQCLTDYFHLRERIKLEVKSVLLT